MIADATTDGTIHVYSLKDGNLIRDLTGSDSYAPTTCLKFRDFSILSIFYRF